MSTLQIVQLMSYAADHSAPDHELFSPPTYAAEINTNAIQCVAQLIGYCENRIRTWFELRYGAWKLQVAAHPPIGSDVKEGSLHYTVTHNSFNENIHTFATRDAVVQYLNQVYFNHVAFTQTPTKEKLL